MTSNKIKSIIIKTLVSTLIILLVYIGGKFYLNNKFHAKGYIPKANQEYKMDLTEFKIKQVLATNKIKSLQVDFSSEITDVRFDNSQHIKALDGLFKLLTTRKLTVSSDFSAYFTYDLSKAIFINDNNENYSIALNINDIESNLTQVSTPKTKEMMSIIGRYYSSDIVSEITYKLQELAKEKVTTKENKIKATFNTKDNILRLLENLNINCNDIKINIEGVN